MINGAENLKNKQLCAEKAASKSGLMAPSIQMEQGSKPFESTANTTPALLLELVTIVTQIAQLDAMFDKISENVPEAGSEAVKWHQVSVQALETSRKYMIEQQMSLIQRLANATGAEVPVQSGNVALEPPRKDVPVVNAAVAPPPGLAMTENGQETANPQSGSPKPAISGECSSLRTDLEKIKMYEPGRVLLVRKIKPFGFESEDHLRTYFQTFGHVTEVLVSHCITKPSAKRANGRVRPAALGVVVMGSLEDANHVFALGEQHSIPFQDTSVCVQVNCFRDAAEDSQTASD